MRITPMVPPKVKDHSISIVPGGTRAQLAELGFCISQSLNLNFRFRLAACLREIC